MLTREKLLYVSLKRVAGLVAGGCPPRNDCPAAASGTVSREAAGSSVL